MNKFLRSTNCTLMYCIDAKLVFLLLLFPTNFVCSQTLLKQENGCILERGVQIKQQVAYANNSGELSGENVLWDFSNWKLLNQNYKLKYFDTGLNTVSKYEHRTFYNYELKNDTLYLCGYKNSTANVSYLLPEVSLIYPLSYRDSISSYFYGVGDYSNHIGLEVYGQKNICVDALGTLILPSGDTVPNIIRVHSEKIMQYQFDSDEIFVELDSIQIPPIDSISNSLFRNTNVIKMDVFEWYMEGYCRPIFETVKNTLYKMGKPYKYFSTAFFCPLEELGDAYIDEIRTQLDNKSDKKYQSNIQSDKDFKFTPYLDEDSRNLFLEYDGVEGATVDVTLFDIQGRLLFHDKFMEQNSGQYKLCIDISQYVQTAFIVRLTINDKIFTKKVFVK